MSERPSPRPGAAQEQQKPSDLERDEDLVVAKSVEAIRQPTEGLPAAQTITKAIGDDDKQQKADAKLKKIIEGQIEWRERKLKDLADYHTTTERTVRALQDYDPLGDLIPADYDALVANKLITKEYADALKALDQKIHELDSPAAPTEEQRLELIKYLELKNSVNDKLFSLIFTREREIEERRAAAKDALLARYQEHTQKLNEIIKHISERPGVAEILREEATQEAELENKKFAADNLRDFKEEFLGGLEPDLQLVLEKNQSAVSRLKELSGDKDLDQKLSTFNSLDQNQQATLINRLRDVMFDAILEGEGRQQLQSPREIVPWRMHRPTDGTTYWQAVDFLTSQEMKQTLPLWKDTGAPTADIEKKLAATESYAHIFRRLFGREWITDEKTKQKKLGSFWAAFEKRKQNDEAGLTEQRKKSRQEIKSLYEKEDPMHRVIAFKSGKGFALVERKAGTRGEYERVAQIVGLAPAGVKEGLSSKDFPDWFRRVVEQAFR